jgi:hypothetical protein
MALEGRQSLETVPLLMLSSGVQRPAFRGATWIPDLETGKRSTIFFEIGQSAEFARNSSINDADQTGSKFNLR